MYKDNNTPLILDKRNFEFIWDTERNKVFWTETQIVGQFSWTFRFIPQLFQKEPWVHVSVHCNRDNKNPNWSCAAEFCLAIKENEVAHRDRHYGPKVLHFMRTWSAKQNPWTFYFTSWKNLEENYFTDGKKLNIEGWISVHEAFGANLASILAESDIVNKTIKDLQLTNEDLKFKLNSVTRELNRMTEERDVLAKKLYPLKEHVKKVELKLERYVTEQEHINNHIQSTEERDIIISELQETVKIKDVEIYRVGHQLAELHEMLMNLRIECQNRVNAETHESVLLMNSKLREQITTLEVERNNYQRQSREYREKLELEAEHRRRAEAEVNILKAEVDKNRGMLSGILAMAANSAVPTSPSRFVPE